MTERKKVALAYTIAMMAGLGVGALFNPVASVFGGFAGLYLVALLTGKISAEPMNEHDHTFCELQELSKGNVLPVQRRKR